LSIDSDTTVMWHTKNAAFHAAGAVISALQDMYSPTSAGYVDTAFCVVRPPGHHAGKC
jgi:acetoin utilization deacetylase AcuC-like enzyme